jgi:hypothetical protein
MRRSYVGIDYSMGSQRRGEVLRADNSCRRSLARMRLRCRRIGSGRRWIYVSCIHEVQVFALVQHDVLQHSLTRPNDWLGVGRVRLMVSGAPCSAATQWYYNTNNTSIVSVGNVYNGAPCGPGYYYFTFKSCYGFDGGVHCSRTGETGSWSTPKIYRS